jgi:3-oxoacyl-[acyl-carrier protein] reductase
VEKLNSKTAIVTGANRGIGFAIAQRLAREGVQLVLCARDATLLNSAKHKVEELGARAATISLDLRLPDAPGRLVSFALENFRRIDIVVNNAGATKRGEFAELTEEDWADGFALKFFGSVRLTRAAWPHLKAVSGSIVNIAGVGGRTPGAQFAIGGSVNAALLSFTKALADAGIRDGIQVNAVNPGAIRTDRFSKRIAAISAANHVDSSAAEQLFVKSERVTRVGEPEDVANLVAFVVSPEGRFLQGALIDVDGGATKTI